MKIVVNQKGLSPHSPVAMPSLGLEFVEKRKKLCEDIPTCLNCGEKSQLQLKDWINSTIWKCRRCGCQWELTS